MALKLSTANPYDGEATDAYWKIVETNINWLTRSSHVTLACYLNQDSRIALKQPITSRSFDWSGDEFPFDFNELDEAGNNTVKLAYEKIKSLTTTDEEGNVIPGEFANAQDV